MTSRTDLTGHDARVTRVRYHRAVRNLLASASAARHVRLWDTEAGKELNALDHGTDMVFDVDWCGDGKQLVSTARDGVVRVWDARSSSQSPVMEVSNGTLCIYIHGILICKATGGGWVCTIRSCLMTHRHTHTREKNK